MPTTYIIKCSDDTLYTGSTTDLKRRFHDHNKTKNGAKYTRGRRPLALVHREEFLTIKEARKREVEIKKMRRCQKEELYK